MQNFRAQDLLDTASRRLSLSDFGPDDFLEPFKIFIEALNKEADIAPDRVERLHERLQRLLMNRLWFAKDLAEHPEILDEKIVAPVIITSLPRTGSTKLHRLLAASNDFQTLSFWKAHMPSRIAGEPDGGTARRVAETREHEQWMYRTSPAILTGHPQFAEEAEEDQWLMEMSFCHPILYGLFETPSYLQWLMQADLRPTFEYFLKQLQYLQWQSQAGSGKPWLIKSPTHFGAEERLQKIFGDMRIIATHRDPAKCVVSITSTSIAVRQLYSDRDTGAGLVQAMTGMWSAAAAGHIGWRDQNPQIPALDVAFRSITSDGLGTARAVYDFLGMEMSPEAEQRMRDWEAHNGREKHGKSAYSAEAYGTTDEAIRGLFKEYMQRFSTDIA